MRITPHFVIVLAVLALAGCGKAAAPVDSASPPAAVDLGEYDITRLQQAMQDGTLSSRRITQWYLDRIAALTCTHPGTAGSRRESAGWQAIRVSIARSPNIASTRWLR